MTEDLAYDAVLLDLEGVLVPVAFIQEKLPDYAREHLALFLHASWDEQDVQACVDALREQASDDHDADDTFPLIPNVGEAPTRVIRAAVEAAAIRPRPDDAPPSPAQQRLLDSVWRWGMEGGMLPSDFYDDAVRALARWKALDVRIAVFSTVSVDGQKRLFAHSEHGELMPFVDLWFDTETGARDDVNTYGDIVEIFDMKASRVLFVGTTLTEARAARDAGLRVMLLQRLGNPVQPRHTFPTEQDLELV